MNSTGNFLLPSLEDETDLLRQEFAVVGDSVELDMKVGQHIHRSQTRKSAGYASAPAAQWWRSRLAGDKPQPAGSRDALRIVDLFSSVGGLSQGARFAAEAIGSSLDPMIAVDMDEAALSVYDANFRPHRVVKQNVFSLVDYHPLGRGSEATLQFAPKILDARLSSYRGNVDVVVAGPPCQGHSNLNNKTRREDDRNGLYIAAVATGLALEAKAMVIENVPAVIRDRGEVVQTAKALLQAAGYFVSDGVLNAWEHGSAQTRKRHFLIATQKPHVPLTIAKQRLAVNCELTLRDAIGDLENIDSDGFMDLPPNLSEENRARIEFMFKNELYDLPDSERPDCHKDGNHTYPSVYGRLRWDNPVPTITTGFMTPGRGRYVHPSQMRVLTPREAARVQGFPDTFDFSLDGEAPAKKLLAKWIGDAVPSQLGYAAVLTAISGI